ncbi:MAG: hypothetical protein CL762_01175 [Chloroflexi bacterium]|nr:hypothetical protein [Chloroflexota bacterium]|tara:strand:- start:14833 stop:15408 length:576 start_codon:yes stop_codon:yes gene_type:complete
MFNDFVNLVNPIVFLDLASTSLDLNSARILRISTIKILPDSTKIFVTNLINPGIKISQEATKIHGINDKILENEKPFSNYSESISKHLKGCDLVGFGIKRYSLPLLRKEFRKSKTFFSIKNRSVIDLMNIYHRVEPRDYKSAYKRFSRNKISNYYDSRGRVEGMIEIMIGQMKEFAEIPKSITEISKWLKN